MIDHKKFEAFETKQQLFDVTIQNVPIWEWVRNIIAKRIWVKQGGNEEQSTIEKNVGNYIRGGIQLTSNLLRKNPFLSDPADLLVVGLSRRKLTENEIWTDIYCDPVLEYCDFEYLYLEKPRNLSHRYPTKTQNIRYLDIVELLPKLTKLLPYSSISLSNEEIETIDKINSEIQRYFDVDIDVYNIIMRVLRHRKVKMPLYKNILQKIDPNLVLIVKHTNKRCLIEICKEAKIPVVELQHGSITRTHFAYSFPDGVKIETFPDYLLTFGNFWNASANYPIEKGRIHAVGYPYLQQESNKYSHIESKKQIIFISQGTIGDDLSKFAVKISQHSDIDYNIIYKLHPEEYDRWRDKLPWLIGADINVIDNTKTPLYKLFAESSVQIGVYSTALFEGLAFDLETYVYGCTDAEPPKSLIEEGTAKLITTANELAALLGHRTSSVNTGYYFSPNATEKTCKLLRWLAKDGTSSR